MDDTHIVGPLNEITCAFDHLSTQLVKVLKCKIWSPLGIFPGIKIPQSCTLVRNGLHILGVLMGFLDFATHFLDEVLSQDVAYINNLLLLGDTQVVLGILSSCVIHQPSYFTWIIFFSFSFMSLLVGFDGRVMQVCGAFMGLGSWESF
jgi:hypothetical protein